MLKNNISEGGSQPSSRSSVQGSTQAGSNNYYSRATSNHDAMLSKFDNLDIRSPIEIVKKGTFNQNLNDNS